MAHDPTVPQNFHVTVSSNEGRRAHLTVKLDETIPSGGLELDAPFAPGLPGLRLLPPPAPEPVVGGPVTRTDVLGVMVAGAPTDDSGPAGGLLVDSVVAGTIAAANDAQYIIAHLHSSRGWLSGAAS